MYRKPDCQRGERQELAEAHAGRTCPAISDDAAPCAGLLWIERRTNASHHAPPMVTEPGKAFVGVSESRYSDAQDRLSRSWHHRPADHAARPPLITNCSSMGARGLADGTGWPEQPSLLPRGPAVDALELRSLRLIAVALAHTSTSLCQSHGMAVSNIRGVCSAHGGTTFALIFAAPECNCLPRRMSSPGVGSVLLTTQFTIFSARGWASSARGCWTARRGVGAPALEMVPMFAAHEVVSRLRPLYTPWQEVLETARVHSALHSPLTQQTRN